jgi:hypothetical protein
LKTNLGAVSYSPYELRVSAVKKAKPFESSIPNEIKGDFIRGLIFEAVKYRILEWITSFENDKYSSHKRDSPEEKAERKYDFLSMELLRPHYLEDSNGCFGDYNIEKSRKIRIELANKAYHEVYPKD